MKLVSGYESIQKALPFGEGWERFSLVNEEKQPGVYEVEFSTSVSHSCEVRNLTSGVYFYQLKAGDFVDTKKMILTK